MGCLLQWLQITRVRVVINSLCADFYSSLIPTGSRPVEYEQY
jgi:hypothetical protein